LSEAGGPSGYTASDWSCESGGVDVTGNQVDLGSGESWTCSITNTYAPTGSQPAYVSILMDRSYSMHKHRGQTISSFNDRLAGEQQMSPDALATMQLFNSCRYAQRGAAGQPITDLSGLAKSNYHPACRTPLYDAIAKTINRAAASQYSASGNVEIAVYTDGLENASKHWDQASLDALIAEKMADGWTFTWLGSSNDPLVVHWRGYKVP
jgi:hypothetical protein